MKFEKSIKILSLLYLLIITASCSSDEDQSSNKFIHHSEGEFKLELSNGKGFTHKTKRFKVISAMDNNWRFKAFGWTVSMDATGLTDNKSPLTSTNLGYNNTFVFFYMDINSKRTYVACRPDQDPQGKITRTKLTDKTVSGNFEFTLIQCKKFNTSEIIHTIDYPLTAKGYFKNIQLLDPFAKYR